MDRGDRPGRAARVPGGSGLTGVSTARGTKQERARVGLWHPGQVRSAVSPVFGFVYFANRFKAEPGKFASAQRDEQAAALGPRRPTPSFDPKETAP